jgi:sulfopyruvate decarboxylase alpha subunit
MVAATDFCKLLLDQGFNLFSGVPCSIFRELIICLYQHKDITYIPATREEEAIGIATGAYLAGKKSAVLMQNTGLANSIGTLGSLNLLYEIPVLLLISWRGYRGKDAPEHLVIGRTITRLLKDIGIPALIMPREGAGEVILKSVKIMEEKALPAAIIVRSGAIE